MRYLLYNREKRGLENSKTDHPSDKNRYIENLEAHIASTKEIAKYSLERFDILIISLSGGGLVVSISLVKDVIKNFEKIDHTLLKLTWIFFSVSLVVNLFSQITAYYANKEEIKISKSLIREKREKPIKHNLKKIGRIKYCLNSATVILNTVCVLSFVTAIILLIIFMNNNI